MKLAIFDMDGTLLNNLATEDACFAAAVSEVLNLPSLNTDWATYHHISDGGIVAEAYRLTYGIHPSPELLAAAIERFVELLAVAHRTAGLEPIMGAEELFTALPTHGWMMAIATGAWKHAAAFKLSVTSLPWESIPIATSEDGPARADIVKCALARAEVAYRSAPFEKIVSVGDGVWDVETARTLRLPFVGVARGARADELRTVGASCVLTDYSDVVATVEALEQALMPLSPVP